MSRQPWLLLRLLLWRGKTWTALRCASSHDLAKQVSWTMAQGRWGLVWSRMALRRERMAAAAFQVASELIDLLFVTVDGQSAKNATRE